MVSLLHRRYQARRTRSGLGADSCLQTRPVSMRGEAVDSVKQGKSKSILESDAENRVSQRSVSYLQALNEAMREEMRRDAKVIVLGEDVEVGGALGILTGLAAEFGKERVLNTPISEAGFVGAAIGLAAGGYRPVVDLMFSPFMWCAMDQCCNQAAKWRYMTGGQISLPIVYRMATGQLGGEAAAQHTCSIYSQFMQVPGLKIVVPASPADAKGL